MTRREIRGVVIQFEKLLKRATDSAEIRNIHTTYILFYRSPLKFSTSYGQLKLTVQVNMKIQNNIIQDFCNKRSHGTTSATSGGKKNQTTAYKKKSNFNHSSLTTFQFGFPSNNLVLQQDFAPCDRMLQKVVRLLQMRTVYCLYKSIQGGTHFYFGTVPPSSQLITKNGQLTHRS